MRRRTAQAGFTLIEIVVVMVLMSIVAAMAIEAVDRPVKQFMEQARRAELTDAAANALARLSRELRGGLPNSVRVGGGSALELLAVVDGERYRTDPPGSAADRLSFSTADASFNTLGPLGVIGTYASHYLAIYPLGQPGADPYVDAVMTPAIDITVASTATPGPPGTDDEYRVTLSAAHLFPLESPAQRVFLVRQPVSYICSGGRLEHYAGYAVMAAQPTTGAATGVAGALVVDRVESCSFSYVAVSARRALVTLEIVLNSDGERVRLLRQVHVDNAP